MTFPSKLISIKTIIEADKIITKEIKYETTKEMKYKKQIRHSGLLATVKV
uniref:Uncharacterized protein n=1 Tax=Arion vulgaris TaxID=1028688 RepID=A0A0B6XZB6_9EUPU